MSMSMKLSKTQVALRRGKVSDGSKNTISIYGPNAQAAHVCCAQCASRDGKTFGILRHLSTFRVRVLEFLSKMHLNRQ